MTMLFSRTAPLCPIVAFAFWSIVPFGWGSDASAPGPADTCIRWAVPSWGDVVCLYGPGTDASMDSPAALEKTILRWKARGMTGVTLRTDLQDFEPMIHRNVTPQQNPRLKLLLDYVDQVSEKFNVLQTAEKISAQAGFEMWAWHPHIFSDGATVEVGKPGWGRMIPWSYSSKYFIDHPEGITVDRKGNKLWMIREYAYPEARAAKVSEFVYMAKELGVKRFLSCMRSEVSQLVDPPEKGDQYGFNQPVVDEMKQRYGVDIMTDSRFDVFSPDFKIHDPMVENWRNLRGEHITQFYRELRQALDEVDPAIKVGVTMSGEYVGPLIGNQRLDWRTWVDEGLVNAINSPVTFEASYDKDGAKKGYLTNVREGVGVVPFSEIKDYIKKSKHPEIAVISGGATAYFDEAPPEATDGWRCDVWYELYSSAWYQRWSQWMDDYKKLGAIHFIDQNFDTFPVDPAKIPTAGALGLVNHNPEIHACPGGWYPFGDEASGNALIQDRIRRGEQGNAVRLTSKGPEGPILIGYHNAEVDRSNISQCLDTSITNGICDFSFWVYRESEQSGLISYLENKGGEMDVGLKIEPGTGVIAYTTGRNSGGTGNWKATKAVVPVGQWQRLTLKVDFSKKGYSAYAGAESETLLAENIPYTPAPPRTAESNGVQGEFNVPSYKAFRQVLFQPLGPAGSKVDLDDLAVLWKPDLVFAPEGEMVAFADDFEKMEKGANLNGLSANLGGKWASIPEAQGPFQVIASTSYREGTKSVLAARKGDIRPVLSQPVFLTDQGMLTYDVDLLVRSDLGYPYIIPGKATTSPNEVSLIIEQAEGGGPAVMSAKAEKGKWMLQENGKFKAAEIPVPYDCWTHVQLAVDMRSRTATLVQQQIGQVAQKIASVALPADFQAGKPLAFRINFGPSNNCVVLDNVKIALGK